MDILFNKAGDPLVFYGKSVFGSTTTKNTVKETVEETFSFREREYAVWGDTNCFPDDAEKTIRATSVLQTGLNYKARCCYGQGVVPVRVTGFDQGNNEIFEPVRDTEVLHHLRGLSVRNFHTASFGDLI